MHEKCPGQSLGSLGGSAGLASLNIKVDFTIQFFTIITITIHTVIIEGQNFAEFVVTLLLVKLSSSNCSFIIIHSIGRVQVNLENKIVKILSNLQPTKYKTFKNYQTHIQYSL